MDSLFINLIIADFKFITSLHVMEEYIIRYGQMVNIHVIKWLIYM